jgi:hypothetical protein
MTNSMGWQVLEWILRTFGLFWVMAGIYALKRAHTERTLDDMLAALGSPQDPLTARFMQLGAGLTLVSGIGLAAAGLWVLLPLLGLVISQPIYFYLKARRWARAQTAEEREDATVMPATRNAFYVSLVILGLACLAAWGGVLR